ncbi:MAG: transcriptional regulator [Clostridiales bacterium]|nr:transcriptional regulator [Clostridiales bacterium]
MSIDGKLDNRVLTQIVNLLEQQFGSNCEVVLHDLSRPYDSTIVDIRNGHITGRRVGDCGSNLGLEVIRGTVKDGDKFNYFTTTKDGKILRSSSIYLRDDENNVRYSLCVNVDITESIKFESFLHNQNRFHLGIDQSPPNGEEVFVNNVHELVQSMLDRGIAFIGKPVEEMSKEEKTRLIEFLDRKGVFLITKSGEKICDALGITKYTFYQMLETVRKNGNGITGEPPDTDMDETSTA